MRTGNMNMSTEQYYNEMSDSLAALRSAKGFIYALIAAAVVFTCVFNSFFGVFFIDGAMLKGEGNVAVVARITPQTVQSGETILIKDEQGYYCAEVTGFSDDSEGDVFIRTQEGQKLIPAENIEGKAECILFPVSCFGDDAHKLCIYQH